MSVDAAVVDFVARVGGFHITHRAMKNAQRRMEASIASGTVDDAMLTAYLREVRRYFEGFDNEARAHLRDVDRRLERANQVHFNLAAERGVAVKRIEATQAVLDALTPLETQAP